MSGGFLGGGRYELRNATMLELIATAWGVDADDGVFGGPNWLETDRFDVLARVPANSTPESRKIMLQEVLADRFRLVVHSDMKPVQAWVLTSGPHPQLKEGDGSGNAGCQTSNEQSVVRVITLSCRNMTMDAFAETLRSYAPLYLGRFQLLDQTGLKGSWNFKVTFSPQAYMVMAGLSGSEGLSIFDAVDKQLGLKLESRMLPAPVMVVDSVNRQPTDNPPQTLQSLPVLPTEFEVTDVKPSAPGATPAGRGLQPVGGRVDLRGFTLQQLILLAWNIRITDSWGFTNDYVLVGAPKWFQTERFDVVAKAPATDPPGPVDPDSLRLMLRALLADRFKLATHFEDRPVTVYAMVAEQPKLKKADPLSRSECRSIPPGSPGANANRVLSVSHTCQNTTMGQLAERLPSIMSSFEHPVVDATGLKGGWDFVLSWSPAQNLLRAQAVGMPVSSDPNGFLTIFEALEKQLGIKLKLQKHPLPVLVVDHVERPSEN
jgi:uncharacterized protein (TIGR03435 family)